MGKPFPSISALCRKYFLKALFLVMVCLGSLYILMTSLMRSSEVTITGATSFPSVSVSDGKFDTLGTCRPLQDIFFLKTHKCAGTTVKNILMRYGKFHGLTFVLPHAGTYLSHPMRFRRKDVGTEMWTLSKKFNIFTHHTRFDQVETEAVMYDDARYVTILREPTSLFESMFSYYGFSKLDLDSYVAKGDFKWMKKRHLSRMGRNQMMFDLGFDETKFDSNVTVRGFVSKLDAVFDLVMISEYMDVSLVLLKELMCWRFEDVVYFSQNSRPTASRSNISEATRHRLLEINYADVVLYQHFLEVFRKKIRNFGVDRMAVEVYKLQKLNKEVQRQCGAKQVLGSKLLGDKRPWNPSNMGFQVDDSSPKICQYMAKSGLAFTKELADAQIVAVRSQREIREKLKHMLGS